MAQSVPNMAEIPFARLGTPPLQISGPGLTPAELRILRAHKNYQDVKPKMLRTLRGHADGLDWPDCITFVAVLVCSDLASVGYRSDVVLPPISTARGAVEGVQVDVLPAVERLVRPVDHEQVEQINPSQNLHDAC